MTPERFPLAPDVRRALPPSLFLAAKQAALLVLFSGWACASSGVAGQVTDPQGKAVAGAEVTLVRRSDVFQMENKTDGQGRFLFPSVEAGEYRLTAEAAGFPSVSRDIRVSGNALLEADLHFSQLAVQSQSVTVTEEVEGPGIFSPDPASRVLIRQEILDANPGRPGMPLSIPGMPVESPAGGIKPPQYFVPGVAGDHGEPIGQFFQVGGYLFPNNLPANAHGNGYADPNVLIPIAIESVQTDGGSFNVREGNNSMNASMIFGLRDRLHPMVRFTADAHDVNLVAGWSPASAETKAWAGLELSLGNGFLGRPERRKQYKLNGSRVFQFGRHDLTVYGIGYHGFSYLPGMAPIGVPVPGDTIDPRQREEASSGIAIVNDVWRLTATRQLQFSGYFRNYYLDVRPDFGGGLIRQSENRTATSQSVNYAYRIARFFSLLLGADYRREAPRNLDLDKFNEAAAAFYPLTSNDITIQFYTPYAALDGALTRYLHYSAGIRRDEVAFDNRDRLAPVQSFQREQGVTSPKGTISFSPEGAAWLPRIALSYGQSFHVDDPRIGTTAIAGGTVVSKARAYQLVIRKTAAHTEFKVTLAHVTTAQQLARIDNDTGLQEDVGPALIRSMTVSARRDFGLGSLQVLFAKADARDSLTGEPTPEAPRLIGDVLGTVERLPFKLRARGEYEYVGRKPLGDGFAAVPVQEFRGAMIRPFDSKGIDVGINLFLVRGFAGQTLETLALPGEAEPFERISGFRLKSYATVSVTYRFRRASQL